MKPQSIRNVATASICALSLACNTAHANVLGAFFYAHVKTESEVLAGLDEPTRKLIESLPANLRTEAVKLVQEAMPLINDSMEKFLADVDTRLASRIDHIACLLGGLIDEAGNTVKGPFADKTPVATLMKEYRARKEFDTSTAEKITYTYIDYVKHLARAECTVGAGDRTAKAVLTVDRLDAVERMSTWNELKHFCSTPADCLVKRVPYMRELVKNSDSRDVDFTRASAKLEQVKATPVSKHAASWLPDRSLKWVADENELVKLHRIERSLEAAQALRSTNAKLYIRDAGIALAKADERLAVAKSHLSSSNKDENNLAGRIVEEALALRQNVVGAATAAIAAHDVQKPEGERVLARFAQVEAEAAQVKRAGQDNNDAIDRRAAAAAKEAQDKADNKVECHGKNGCVGPNSK
ncbi:hypothetical protein [Acidovorax sp. sic0104]|uniref:hypothetical protein n=1 Tax=Acidovorax sp. sic0104 TaxID=2854784 RepID=UPI001C44DA04|nr:hypothetical protein [Acidovorax sp. sic0104]MBV7541965.1 hypothetical protein [Acidovorax sp. sic0104]